MKIFLPFLLAVLLHAALFVVFQTGGKSSAVLISNNQALEAEGKHFIPLQFGFANARPANKKEKRIETKPTAALPSAETEKSGATGPGGAVNGNGEKGSGQGSSFGFSESVVNFEEPVYPIAARKKGIEGSLIVQIVVSAEGIPASFKITKSSGHQMLDEAVLKVIPRWRFQKRAANNSYQVEKTLVFKIK